MEQLFPRAFVTGRRELPDAACVMEDALTVFRSIGDSVLKPDPETGRVWVNNGSDLVAAVKKSAEHYLGGGCMIYCIVNDIYGLVPVTKGEEQGKRQSQSAKSQRDHQMELPIDFVPYTELSKPYLRLDKPLPLDWSLAMCDRKGFRAWVIGWTSIQLVSSTNPHCKLRVPEGKIVVLHGHCLTREFIEEANARGGGFGNKIDIPKHEDGTFVSDETLNEIPLIVSGGDGGFPIKARFALELWNMNGEAEFAFFVLYRKLQTKFPSLLSMDVLSVDTDLMLLLMVYLHKYGEEIVGDLTWKFSHGGWVLKAEAPNASEERRVDINTLAGDVLRGNFYGKFDNPSLKSAVEEDPRTTHDLREKFRKTFPLDADCYGEPGGAIWQICAALAMASDYTSPFYGITQWRIVKALFKQSDYIGPLVKFNRHAEIPVKVDVQAFTRLVKCAYTYATRRLAGVDPSTVRVRDIRDATEKRNGKLPALPEKAWFPTVFGLDLRMRHLTLYLHLMSQIGNERIEEPSDVTHFGYMLVDAAKGITRDNIVRQTEAERPANAREEEEPRKRKRNDGGATRGRAGAGKKPRT
jgi:hypothetical protein